MMENAGRHLAELARQRFLDGDPKGKRIIVPARLYADLGVDVGPILSRQDIIRI